MVLWEIHLRQGVPREDVGSMAQVCRKKETLIYPTSS